VSEAQPAEPQGAPVPSQRRPAPPRPPWDWASLEPRQRALELERLGDWVRALRDDYRAWVNLPDCWPLHEPLRSELAFFWYWQREILGVRNRAAEGVHWHEELRRSADAWRRLSTCRHEERETPGVLSARDRSTVREREHLREAIAGFEQPTTAE
jgi:hypothetical protein